MSLLVKRIGQEEYKKMSDKFSVNPGDVRGYGNITLPKTLGDYVVYCSSITSSQDSVDGISMNVTSISYKDGSRLTVTTGAFIEYATGMEYFTVSALLTDLDETVISGAGVSCVVNDDVPYTGVTDSNGVVEFDIPLGTGSEYLFRMNFDGNNTVSGCSAYGQVWIGTPTGLTLVSASEGVQEDNQVLLTATLNGTGIGDVPMAIPGQIIEFYENYTPDTLRVKIQQLVFQVDDGIDLIASIHDTDGSRITVAGETINFYEWYTLDSVRLISKQQVITTGDTTEIIGSIHDTDGSRISGEPLAIFQDDPDYDYTDVWKQFDESTTARKLGGTPWNYFKYNGDGSVALKSAVLNNYFLQSSYDGLWEMQFDYSYPEGMLWTGLLVLVDYDAVTNMVRARDTQYCLSSYQDGTILGLPGDLPPGARIRDNPVVETWNTIHVKKTDDTTLVLWKNDDYDNRVTYTWPYLSDFDKVSIGGNNDVNGPSLYGKAYIRNWIVKGIPAGELPVVSSVALSSSAASITDGSSVTFTALVKDQFGDVMNNQSVTFKDGSTTLGTGTTNSSGIATLTKSDFSVRQHTITATAGEITSSSVTVNVTPSSVVTTMTVSSDKSVLSYYDSETATLQALVKDQYGSPMAGQGVVFKKGSTTVAERSTNSNGIAVYQYSSTGAGDVGFTVECSNLQETYSIEDAVLYRETLSTSVLNINLPSNFEMSWKVHRTNGSTNENGLSQPQLQDNTHNYFIGQYGSLGQCGFIIRNQRSSTNLVNKTLSSNLPNNTDETIVYSFNNGTHTCGVDGIGTVSDTNSYVPTKLYSVSVGSKNIMKEFKLKPL